MATTLPTFKNNTAYSLPIPRYNFSSFDLPSGKYVTGDYFLQNDTLDGQSTGVALYVKLGLTNVSTGDDPDSADIFYDYTLAEVVPSQSELSVTGPTGEVNRVSLSPEAVEIMSYDLSERAASISVFGNEVDTKIDLFVDNLTDQLAVQLLPPHLTVSYLRTYADNAEALSGGLTVNDIYKTSTGEIRIVVAAP